MAKKGEDVIYNKSSQIFTNMVTLYFALCIMCVDLPWFSSFNILHCFQVGGYDLS